MERRKFLGRLGALMAAMPFVRTQEQVVARGENEDLFVESEGGKKWKYLSPSESAQYISKMLGRKQTIEYQERAISQQRELIHHLKKRLGED